MSIARAAVSVDELQRAWTAIQEGAFRCHPVSARLSGDAPGPVRTSAGPNTPIPHQWVPAGQVIAVAGAAGRVGASTVALAIATAAQVPARVVECCSPPSSGFAAAATAELGVDEHGWRHGTRGPVVIERTTTAVDDPNQIPAPAPTATEMTVIDTGWNLGHLLTTRSWVCHVVETSPVVLVTVATIPGMRALDNAIQVLEPHTPMVCAVVGPRRKKWPRPVVAAMSPAVATADATGRIVTVDQHQHLAVVGLTPEPLPADLVMAGRQLLDHASRDDRGDPADIEAQHQRAEYQRRDAS